MDTLAIGVTLDQFWRLTYAEVRLYHEAAEKRLREQHESRMFAILQLANLGRMTRLPRLAALVPWMEQPPQYLDDEDELTDEEREARALAREAADHAYLMQRLSGRKGVIKRGPIPNVESRGGH